MSNLKDEGDTKSQSAPTLQNKLVDIPENISVANGKQEPTISTSKPRTRYGWFGFYPTCLQFLNSPTWLLVVLCLYTVFCSSIANGFIPATLTTLEKRLGLSSAQMGSIYIVYDVGSIASYIPFSFFGNHNKPRWISAGALCMAAGAMMYSMPHFVSPVYMVESADEASAIQCLGNSSAFKCPVAGDVNNGDSNTLYVVFLIIGQLLLGIGSPATYSLTPAFLDESVPNSKSAMYMGIFFAMAVVGSSLGFIGNGFLLTIPTDLIDQGVDSSDSLFVGAWWIGFVISGACLLLVTILISGYPVQLPDFDVLHAARIAKGEQESCDSRPRIQELPKRLLLVMQRPIITLVILAMAINGFVEASFIGFLVKYLATKFDMTFSSASNMMGLIVAPAGAIGHLSGGFISKRFSGSLSGNMKILLVAAIFNLCLSFSFLGSCDRSGFAGLTVPYPVDSHSDMPDSLIGDCNADCGCSLYEYDPICIEGVSYYSKCYAGCSSESGECRCVPSPAIATISNSTAETGVNPGHLEDGFDTSWLEADLCTKGGCAWMYVFLVILFFCILLYLVAHPALSYVLLRVADHQDRSLCLALERLFQKLLGGIPGPIIMGRFIDAACILWSTSCSESGDTFCLRYDAFNVGALFTVYGVVASFLLIVLSVVTIVIINRNKDLNCAVVVTEEMKLEDGSMKNETLA